ncbi:L-threonylcarbamoyladenylate synthase [Flavobacterium sp. RSB2_4_14]|uniref:L-threonylcarbamoyladenylate synthase n=1 Tax=Flavobacterium sp. RSB2_4_14 TaxID=3447665 RepID=UPI003F374ED2
MKVEIEKAAALLEEGNVVAIPTETVYGLAANAFDEDAVRKIFEIKGRPLFNPLIVHIKSIDFLEHLVNNIPPKALQLAQHFWPGSLTLILPKKEIVPNIITAEKDTVAVRVPNHPVTLALLDILDFPLAAPSANPFGTISPTEAKHVIDYFKDTIPMVLDGGICQNGIESTIVGFEFDEPVLYRLGSITVEEIEKIVGRLSIKNKKEVAPDAPGMLERHYAPKTKTFLETDVNAFIQKHPDKKIGVLLFNQRTENHDLIHQEILSENGNYKEAALNLYAAMHRLDKLGLDLIVAERFPDIDLGKSINDRLERATKN